MAKWSLRGIAASAVALIGMALPMQAQMPTISDVNSDAKTEVTGPTPAWDVAIIKPHPPEDQMMSWRMTADGVSLVNLSLEQLLCNAWDMKPYQLSGLAGWMKSSKYDLTAKVSGEDVPIYGKLNIKQRREMLQKLLAENFQLKTHLETKTLPVYDLVVAKTGSKLKPTTAIEAPSDEEAKAHPEKYKKHSMTMGPGMYEAAGVPVRSLASQLSNALDQPVHDETGLTGLYDITFHYRRDESGTDSDGPSIFSAVQEQLGLKLMPGKGPVETLVVDAAEKLQAN